MSTETNAAVAAIIPPGVIVAYGGENIPLGWELCQGQRVRKDDSKYKDLFEAIGTAWGGTGTPFFHLPDLRGIFLRGVSGDSDRDAEKKDRLPARPDDADINNQGNKGNAVGSYQMDALQSHNHGYNAKKAEAEGGKGFWGFDFDNNSSTGRQPFRIDSTGGVETRPKNAYVNYMIKL